MAMKIVKKFRQDVGGCVVDFARGRGSGLTHRRFSLLANWAMVRNPSSAREEKIQLLLIQTCGIQYSQ